jgi:GT2 family glycosyltransferase
MHLAEISRVGICVLNFHHPEETLACVVSLLAKEPPSTQILWLENEARVTRGQLLKVLAIAPFPWVELHAEATELPPSGTVGVILNDENLGYAGGNNVGLKLLNRSGIPFAWVLNNDTELVRGSSAGLMAAARDQPGIGIWGTLIRTERDHYFGGLLHPRHFATSLCRTIAELSTAPLAFVSGCSMFFRLDAAAAIGFIPEEYFLYYEDLAFTLEMRRINLGIAALDAVEIRHIESLSTGHRSPLMEFYSKRNRWFFIQRYFPERLPANRWRLLHTLQKYLFRGRWARFKVEVLAFIDFRKGRQGRTGRVLSRKDLT